MPTINLAGRKPVVIPVVSGKVVWVFAGLGVVVLVAVILGFRYRIQTQQARKTVGQTQVVAADAATSNRPQVEAGSMGGLPVAGTSPITSTTTPNGLPANGIYPPSSTLPVQPCLPSTPTGQPCGQLGAAYTPPAPYPTVYPSPYPSPYPPVVPYQPISYPGMDRPAASLESSRSSPTSRLRERELAAREAPTGAAEERAAQSRTSSSPEADLTSQLSALLRPPSPSPVSAFPVSLPGSVTAPSAALLGAGGEGAQGFPGQNNQLGKKEFGEHGEATGDDYLKTTRTLPLSRWVVQRGTVIPASLPNNLVSDLPGDLIAEVVRDVYDSPTQRYVEIPAGSRLVGEYNSSVSYAQNRVQVVWTAIYFPDGTFVDLDRMPSHSADGATGLKDKTDNHYKRLIAGVALSSLLAAGLSISQNRSQGNSVLTYPSTGQVIASSIGSQASQLGEQLTNRNLNIQPTLKIRAGEIFAVSVKKDILFPGPYEPMVAK